MKNASDNTNSEFYEDIYNDSFSFGKNWSEYLNKLTPQKIEVVKKTLQDFTGLESFVGKTFIDVGCGSGLFSLAAKLLGADTVQSVDVDTYSIQCAQYLKKVFFDGDDSWKINTVSILDVKSLAQFSTYDIVYSWGVLHHTGDMWAALENVIRFTKPDSLLYIAIYNDFNGLGIKSKTWVTLKKVYNNHGRIIKKSMEWLHRVYIIVGLLMYGRNPITYIRNYDKDSSRGMDFFCDNIDWLGGYPYEYASKEAIEAFYLKHNFRLEKYTLTNTIGCNEFLLRKKTA